MVVKEKLLKKYGYQVIYKPLIDDLKKLEKGIWINYPERRFVKCGVLLHAGDNLESVSVGGFSMSFSSRDICRFCHIQHSELVNSIHDYDTELPRKYWTPEEYDKICDLIESEGNISAIATLEQITVAENLEDHLFDVVSEDSDEEDDVAENRYYDDESLDEEDQNMNINCHGLRHRCPFNTLESFHAVINFPPDFLHDVLEGVVAQDLCGIIKIFISEGLFSLDKYNKVLQNHRYKSYEMNDRPQLISSNKKVNKLPGKAVSIWVHMRSFGMLIKEVVSNHQIENDEVFLLAMTLAEITERLAAAEFRNFEIDMVEELIVKYLDDRKSVFEHYPILGTPKPKHHFLSHYGEAIRQFGPPLCFWTGRYEAKHRIAKSAAESAKNFKNISLTLSVRQQLRMSSRYYSGMFDTACAQLPDKLINYHDLPSIGDELFDQVRLFMDQEDAVCNRIVLRGQEYKNGEIIVLKASSSNTLDVGVILTILVKPKDIYFITRRYKAVRNVYNYFETSSVGQSSAIMVKATELADVKPLLKYGTYEKFKFYLHHHISYDHD